MESEESLSVGQGKHKTVAEYAGIEQANEAPGVIAPKFIPPKKRFSGEKTLREF